MSKLIEILKQHQPYFPVVPFDGLKDKLLLLDFSERNTELSEEIFNDTKRFADYINTKLQTSNAKYGIGGYAENRIVYSRSHLFKASAQVSPVGGDLEGAARSLHLGMDIWGDAGTPVYSPLNAIIHSFNFNDNYGDYGATIILLHELDGFNFHTLYGHLSQNSLQVLKQNQSIEKGQFIASLGEPHENGHWPPHLHFQLIIDMQGMKGDYPGVCAVSEKEKYLANCPNPDLILNMMQYATSTEN